MRPHLHVLLRNLDILEGDSTGITGALSHVLLLAADDNALGVAVDDEASECRASSGIGISLVQQKGTKGYFSLLKIIRTTSKVFAGGIFRW